MTLTVGTGPFGHTPAGSFNVEVPREGVTYVEPSPRRIRALLGRETVLDTRRARMVHEQGRLPRYVYPRDDVRLDLVPSAAVLPAGVDGHIELDWHAMDAWFEEDDEIIGHAPDPYHRIDVRNTSRRVRVSLDGRPLADSGRARVLFETSLPPRWYLPVEDVVVDLEPSDLRTICAYKGEARYWSVPSAGLLGENLSWSYAEPRPEAAAVVDMVCFFNEQVEIEVDGERQDRPGGPWARPGWWRSDG
jgi:uncharacterized protein (DUF427 family)